MGESQHTYTHRRKEMNFDESVGRDGGIKVKYIFESVMFIYCLGILPLYVVSQT